MSNGVEQEPVVAQPKEQTQEQQPGQFDSEKYGRFIQYLSDPENPAFFDVREELAVNNISDHQLRQFVYKVDDANREYGTPSMRQTLSFSDPSVPKVNLESFEQSAWADFGDSVYNSFWVRTGAGIQETIPGAVAAWSGWHGDKAPDWTKSWVDSVQEWSHDNTRRISDSAQGSFFDDPTAKKFASGLGQGVGSIVPAIAGAVLGKGIGTRIGIGARAGSVWGGAMGSYLNYLDAAFVEAHDSGLSFEDAWGYANIIAPIIAASETVALHALGKTITRPIGSSIQKKLFSPSLSNIAAKGVNTETLQHAVRITKEQFGDSLLKYGKFKFGVANLRAIEGMGIEAFQEFSQSYMESFTQNMYDNYFAGENATKGQGMFGMDVTSKDALMRALEEGFYGGIIGGGMAHTGTIFSPMFEESMFHYLSKDKLEGGTQRAEEVINYATRMHSLGKIDQNGLNKVKEYVEDITSINDKFFFKIKDPSSTYQAYNLFKFRDHLQEVADQVNGMTVDAGFQDQLTELGGNIGFVAEKVNGILSTIADNRSEDIGTVNILKDYEDVGKTLNAIANNPLMKDINLDPTYFTQAIKLGREGAGKKAQEAAKEAAKEAKEAGKTKEEQDEIYEDTFEDTVKEEGFVYVSDKGRTFKHNYKGTEYNIVEGSHLLDVDAFAAELEKTYLELEKKATDKELDTFKKKIKKETGLDLVEWFEEGELIGQIEDRFTAGISRDEFITEEPVEEAEKAEEEVVEPTEVAEEYEYFYGEEKVPQELIDNFEEAVKKVSEIENAPDSKLVQVKKETRAWFKRMGIESDETYADLLVDLYNAKDPGKVFEKEKLPEPAEEKKTVKEKVKKYIADTKESAKDLKKELTTAYDIVNKYLNEKQITPQEKEVLKESLKNAGKFGIQVGLFLAPIPGSGVLTQVAKQRFTKLKSLLEYSFEALEELEQVKEVEEVEEVAERPEGELRVDDDGKVKVDTRTYLPDDAAFETLFDELTEEDQAKAIEYLKSQKERFEDLKKKPKDRIITGTDPVAGIDWNTINKRLSAIDEFLEKTEEKPGRKLEFADEITKGKQKGKVLSVYSETTTEEVEGVPIKVTTYSSEIDGRRVTMGGLVMTMGELKAKYDFDEDLETVEDSERVAILEEKIVPEDSRVKSTVKVFIGGNELTFALKKKKPAEPAKKEPIVKKVVKAVKKAVTGKKPTTKEVDRDHSYKFGKVAYSINFGDGNVRMTYRTGPNTGKNVSFGHELQVYQYIASQPNMLHTFFENNKYLNDLEILQDLQQDAFTQVFELYDQIEAYEMSNEEKIQEWMLNKFFKKDDEFAKDVTDPARSWTRKNSTLTIDDAAIIINADLFNESLDETEIKELIKESLQKTKRELSEEVDGGLGKVQDELNDKLIALGEMIGFAPASRESAIDISQRIQDKIDEYAEQVDTTERIEPGTPAVEEGREVEERREGEVSERAEEQVEKEDIPTEEVRGEIEPTEDDMWEDIMNNPGLDLEEDSEHRLSKDSIIAQSESIRSNPEQYAKIKALFKKVYPGLTVTEVNDLVNQYGTEIAGRIAKYGIQINPNSATQHTIVHEYGHAYLGMIEKKDSKLFQEGMDLVKGTPYFDEAKKIYSDKSEKKQLEEALNILVSDKGLKQIKGKIDGNIFKQIVNWLQRVWAKVKRLFGKATVEDVATIMANELISGKYSLETVSGREFYENRDAADIKLLAQRTFNKLRLRYLVDKSAFRGLHSIENYRKMIYSGLLIQMKADKVARQGPWEGINITKDEIDKLIPLDKNGIPKYREMDLVKITDVISKKMPDYTNYIDNMLTNVLGVAIPSIIEDTDSPVKPAKKLNESVRHILSTLVDHNGDLLSKHRAYRYMSTLSMNNLDNDGILTQLKEDANNGYIMATALNNLIASLDVANDLDRGIRNGLLNEIRSNRIARFHKALYSATPRRADENLDPNEDIDPADVKIEWDLSTRLYEANRSDEQISFEAELKNLIVNAKARGLDSGMIKGLGSTVEERQFQEMSDIYSEKDKALYIIGAISERLGLGLSQESIERFHSDLNIKGDVDKLRYVKSMSKTIANVMDNPKADVKKQLTGYIKQFGKAKSLSEGYLSDTFINIDGERVSTIRLGAYIDKLDKILNADQEFRNKISKSEAYSIDGKPVPVLKRMLNRGVEYSTVSGIQNTAKDNTANYRNTSAQDYAVLSLLNFAETDQNSYWQNYGVRGDRDNMMILRVPRYKDANEVSAQIDMMSSIESKHIMEDLERVRNDESIPDAEIDKAINGKIKELNTIYHRMFPAFLNISKSNKGRKTKFKVVFDNPVKKWNDKGHKFTQGIKTKIAAFQKFVDDQKLLEPISDQTAGGIYDKNSLITNFVFNDSINRWWLQKIMQGRLDLLKSPQNIIKRAIHLDSPGNDIDLGKTPEGKNKPIFYMYVEDNKIEEFDGTESTDAFKFVGRHLNKTIKDNGGSVNQYGNNQKAIVSYNSPEGINYYVKSASLGIEEIVNDKDEVIGVNYDYLDNKYTGEYTRVADAIMNIEDILEARLGYKPHVEVIFNSADKGSGINKPAITREELYSMDNEAVAESLIDKFIDEQEVTSYRIQFNINHDFSKDTEAEMLATGASQLFKILMNFSDNSIEAVNAVENALVAHLNKQMKDVKDYSRREVLLPELIRSSEDFNKDLTSQVLKSVYGSVMANYFSGRIDTLLQEEGDTIEVPWGLVRDLANKSYDLDIKRAALAELAGKVKAATVSVSRDSLNNIYGLIEAQKHEKPITALDHPAVVGVTESILSGILSKAGIKPKLPGGGLQMVPDIENKLKFRTEKGKIGNQEADIYYGEVVVPEGFAQVGEDLITVRVPVSGFVSVYVARVVETSFTKDNIIVGPAEYIHKSDADHDGDKLFTYRKNYQVDTTGPTPQYVLNKQGKKVTEQSNTASKLIDEIMLRLADPNSVEKSKGSLGLETLRESVDMISKEQGRELNRFSNIESITPMGLGEIHAQMNEGKDLIGKMAVGTKLLSMLAQSGEKLKSPLSFGVDKMGNLLPKNDRSDYQDFKFDSLEETARYLQAALDNAKEFILSSLGINNNTAAEFIVLAGLGVRQDDLIRFFRHPAIEELNRRIYETNSVFSHWAGMSKRAIIKKYMNSVKKQEYKDVLEMFFKLTEIADTGYRPLVTIAQMDQGLSKNGYQVREDKKLLDKISKPNNLSITTENLSKRPLIQHYSKMNELLTALYRKHFLSENARLEYLIDDVVSSQKFRSLDFGSTLRSGFIQMMSQDILNHRIDDINQFIEDSQNVLYDYASALNDRIVEENEAYSAYAGLYALRDQLDELTPEGKQDVLDAVELIETELITGDVKKVRDLFYGNKWLGNLDVKKETVREWDRRKKDYTEKQVIKIYPSVSFKEGTEAERQDIINDFALLPQEFKDQVIDYTLLTSGLDDTIGSLGPMLPMQEHIENHLMNVTEVKSNAESWFKYNNRDVIKNLILYSHLKGELRSYGIKDGRITKMPNRDSIVVADEDLHFDDSISDKPIKYVVYGDTVFKRVQVELSEEDLHKKMAGELELEKAFLFEPFFNIEGRVERNGRVYHSFELRDIEGELKPRIPYTSYAERRNAEKKNIGIKEISGLGNIGEYLGFASKMDIEVDRYDDLADVVSESDMIVYFGAQPTEELREEIERYGKVVLVNPSSTELRSRVLQSGSQSIGFVGNAKGTAISKARLQGIIDEAINVPGKRQFQLEEDVKMRESEFGEQAFDHMIDNPEIVDDIVSELRRLYPEINARPDMTGKLKPGQLGYHERIKDENGHIISLVRWSQTDGRLDTIPHEYAHDYIEMFINTDIVKEGIEKYGKERLVSLIGRKYTGKKMSEKFDAWYTRFWNWLKSLVGSRDVADVLAKHFSRGTVLGEKTLTPTAKQFQTEHFEADSDHLKRHKFDKNYIEFTEDEKSSYEKGTEINVRGKKIVVPPPVQAYEAMSNDLAIELITVEVNEALEDVAEGVVTQEVLNDRIKDKMGILIGSRIDQIIELDKERGEFKNIAGLDLRRLKDIKRRLGMDVNRKFNYDTEYAVGMYNKIIEAEVLSGDEEIDFLIDDDLQVVLNIIKHASWMDLTQNTYIVGNGKRINQAVLDKSIMSDIEEVNSLRLERFNKAPKWIQPFIKGIFKYGTYTLNLPRMLHIMTGSKDSKLSRLIYGGFIKADRDWSEFGVKLSEFNKPVIQIKGLKGWSSYLDKKATIKDLDTFELRIDDIEDEMAPGFNTKKVTITKAEAISLFMNLRRPDARDSILENGIYLSDQIEGRIYKEGDVIKISQETIDDLQEIMKSNPEMWTVVRQIDKMLNYSYSKMNPVFKELNGIDLPQIPKYFPGRTDWPKKRVEEKKNIITDISSIHERLGQNKPIRIEDYNKVMYGHMSSTATYSSYAIPVVNTRNFHDTHKDRYANTDLERFFDHIDGFVRRIQDSNILYSNQGEKAWEQYLNKLLGNFSVAALGWNVPVMFKQPVSYMNASNRISPKYLGKVWKNIPKDVTGVLTTNNYALPIWKEFGDNDVTINEIKNNSVKLRHRLLGFVDRELGELTMGAHFPFSSVSDDLIKVKIGGKERTISKSRFMKGIQVFDAATIRAIWRAVKAEAADLHPDLKPDTKEYWEHIAARTEMIVNDTQPTYDLLHRAELASWKSPFARMMTMFSSQRNKNWQMLVEKGYTYAMNPTAENKRQFIKTFNNIMIISSAAIASIDIMKSTLFYGIPDDDDDAMAIMGGFGKDMMLKTLMNDFGYIYLVGDFMNAVLSKVDDKPWEQSLTHPFQGVFNDGRDALGGLLAGDVDVFLKKGLLTVGSYTGMPRSIVTQPNALTKTYITNY
jgi:hypothetical protein